jgi:hypothetical protein
MRQQLHLLVVDRASRTALAARYGTRWMCPTLGCDELARAGPVVQRWCGERGLTADVAGQWLGRAAADTMDWLVAAPVRDAPAAALAPLEWISLDGLAGRQSVIDYQTWALARALEGSDVPEVGGPFGRLDWPDRMRSWIEGTLATPVRGWIPFRTSPREVVIGVETPRGRVYCKGLAADRAAEAILTRRLAAVAPESFARTIALQERDGATLWLTAECGGSPTRDSVLVAIALARLQQQLRSLAEDRSLLDPADLSAALRWTGRPQMRDALAKATAPHVPQSWIPMDLDRTNVLNDSGRVSFIDLDESFAGPAPLAMAAFALRAGSKAEQAYRAYERSWTPPLRNIDWRSLEIAAAAFQAWRGWRRLTENVARGDVCVALDEVEARVRERLAAAAIPDGWPSRSPLDGRAV